MRGVYKYILNHPRLPSRNIPEQIVDRIKGTPGENSELKFLWQYKKTSIRRRYAVYGQSSGKSLFLFSKTNHNHKGLKAGICWPTKEELNYMKEYEAKFEKSFQEMAERLQKRKAKEAKERTAREEEVMKNLKKLPTMKEKFWTDYHKLFADIEEEKIKKEKVIQDVREYLGYDIDPSDPRFEEALAKKDEDEKASMRAARKLDKQRQHMEMLQALVSEALEKEAKKSEPKEPQPADSKDSVKS